MNKPDPTSSQPLPASREGLLVLLLGVLAAAHVFIYAAALPFFNPVDEEVHLDLVVHYSQLDLPRAVAPLTDEARTFIAFFSTWEYHFPASAFPGGLFPPPIWTRSKENAAINLENNIALLKHPRNYEAAQPPLYYALAGGYWRLGRALDFGDSFLLYGVRFLNGLVIIAVVWLAYVIARMLYPANAFIRLGVPTLIAFMPQSAFYTIQSDVLMPIGFGLALLGLLRWFRGELLSFRLAGMIGFSLSALYLTKLTSLPLLAVVGVAVGLQLWHLAKAGTLRPILPATGLLLVCAGVPIVLWSVWIKHNFGDFTGSVAKMEYLRWTHMPFSEWWHHPIFTPTGLWTYISGLCTTFWQGEITWQNQHMNFPWVDLTYTLLSLGFLGLVSVGFWRGRNAWSLEQRLGFKLGAASVFASVAFLGFLSIIYDFHDCVYPSRAYPYFTSGRLILGALIPFALLFVSGMDWAFGRCKGGWARPLALGALVLFMLGAELAMNWPVFFSKYNWFHM